ncbi:hypothetical protein M9Y10_013031 [Tritrichomonas musculus]|uniref:Uncharacterized protein n=1 Tax=Tritrichomonas musculus TaxID=1915356 RepID=A0ABR2I5Y5_9EUKA
MSVKPTYESSLSPYSPRNRAKSSRIVGATYNQIYDLNDDLELLSKNIIQLRSHVLDLEAKLEAITNAIKGNIRSTQEFISRVEESNENLSEEIAKREQLMAIERPLIEKCIQKNPQLLKGHEDLINLMIPISTIEPGLDPLVNRTLPTLEYFHDVKTNSAFVQRCKLIINEIKKLEGPNPTSYFVSDYQQANTAVLRRQLKKVQINNESACFDYTEKINQLTLEKEKLLEEKRNLVNAQISSRESVNGTPKKTFILPRSTPTTPVMSPIKKRTAQSSPMNL